MNTFSVTTKMTFPEFRKLNFKILYAKKWVVILSIFAILFVLASVVMNMMHYNVILDSDYYSIGVIFVVMPITLPLTVLLLAKRSFKSNSMIQESITYEFSEESLKTNGESFSSEYKWEKLHKVDMTNEWLLLYHSKTVANFVKIKDVNNANLEGLKDLLKIKDIKLRLIK